MFNLYAYISCLSSMYPLNAYFYDNICYLSFMPTFHIYLYAYIPCLFLCLHVMFIFMPTCHVYFMPTFPVYFYVYISCCFLCLHFMQFFCLHFMLIFYAYISCLFVGLKLTLHVGNVPDPLSSQCAFIYPTTRMVGHKDNFLRGVEPVRITNVSQIYKDKSFE